MKASIIDLRYHMNDVLKALDRNEVVEIFYHGKKKGTIVSVGKKTAPQKVASHPFFGMLTDSELSVDEIMQDLRGGRYHVD